MILNQESMLNSYLEINTQTKYHSSIDNKLILKVVNSKPNLKKSNYGL